MAARKIVVLTGAGISADSGVSTFRDQEGVWAQYDYREVATPEGFAANPTRVHEFYNLRRAGLNDVEPNAAHFALAELQTHLQGVAEGHLSIVTQNVDDLHERGGAREVLHMHGELLKMRCEACGTILPCASDIGLETVCPACDRPKGLRPHIVWFGEMPFLMDEIEARVLDSDLFVSIGTSGSVYPAAGFVALAKDAGVPCLELNLEPSDNASFFDEARYGNAREIVPEWVQEILKQETA